MATWTVMKDVPNPLFDSNGNPASGFILKAYDPGGVDVTSIAISSSGASPQTSITANAEGKWEVSGNEILPYIDKKHKWGIFATSAAATANTPFYMGPFDDVEVVESAGSANEFATIAAVRASTQTFSATNIYQLNGYYALGDMHRSRYTWNASSTATDDGGSVIKIAAITTGRLLLIENGLVFAEWFGTKTDGSTDDTTEINNAIIYMNGNTDSGGDVVLRVGTSIVSDDLSNLAANDTGIRLLDNVRLIGISRAGSIIKMKDSAANGASCIRAAAGASIPWNLTRVDNCAVENLTVDGNRVNHTRVTVSDGVTNASDATVTSASAPFTQAMADDGHFIYMETNGSQYAITNIVASGSNAIVTAVGHDFIVGDKVLIKSITGSGDFTGMNNNNFTITAVTTDILGVNQSFTVVKTLASGSYTSGGTADGGKLVAVITTFNSSTSVEVSITPSVTTASNGFVIEIGENGWGIEVVGADNMTIRDVTAKNCWGDGIYIDHAFGSPSQLDGSTNITIDNVDCDGNRRQGLSIVSGEQISIFASMFRNTGIDGVGPGAGIDIEPDFGRIRDIFIDKCYMIDNEGPGFTSSIQFADSSGTPLILDAATKYGTWNVNVTNSVMRGNGNYGASIAGVNEGNLLDNNKIEQNRKGGIRFRGVTGGKTMLGGKITNNYIAFNQWYKGTVGSSDPDDNANGHGIMMGNAALGINMETMTIQGNTIEYNDGHGIYSSGVANDFIKIHDNDIVGNGQEIDNIYSNIKCEGTQGVGLSIMQNRIGQGATGEEAHPYGVSSGLKQSKYGIEVTTTGGSYNSEIAHNNVQSAGQTANMVITNMRIDTAGGDNWVFANKGYRTEANIFSGARNSATTNATNAPQSVTIAHGMPITPITRHCTPSIVNSSMTTVPIFHIPPYIVSTDGTNVTVGYSIGTGGVGNFLINVRIQSDPYDT